MIVTTFSPEGYELYGKRFVETYKKHCPYKLVIYVEDDLKIDGVETRNLFDVKGIKNYKGCSGFLDAIKTIKPDPVLYKNLDRNYYRMNVNKFCRKVFAIHDASKEGRFAFIGADTIFHNDIPDTFLDDILDSVYIAYLGRKSHHSETDFIAFDTFHYAHKVFVDYFLRIYITGAFQSLKYWCDSDVFDFLLTMLNPPRNNLNVVGDEVHPFVNSILGDYMTHLKGPKRKEMGKCFDSDYIDKRRVQV